jgi:hypothetical protein
VKAYRRWRRIAADDPYAYVRRILVNDAASRRRLRATQEIVSLPDDVRWVPDATEALAATVRPVRGVLT